MKWCNFRFDVNILLVKKNFKDNFLWYFFTASSTSYLYATITGMSSINYNLFDFAMSMMNVQSLERFEKSVT